MADQEHDSLCPSRHKEWIKSTYCTYCQLIRKAREEERQILSKFMG